MSAAAIVIAGGEGFRSGAVPLPERCLFLPRSGAIGSIPHD
jgi:hypothetical protein